MKEGVTSPLPQTTAERLVDYAKSLDCIHCGLCLNTCPTYRMTGAEPSSPRGRVHLMRAVAEQRLPADAAFAEEMNFCLVCRHCESVCPAGVQFGAMMETTRDALGRARPRGLFERMLRAFAFRWLLRKRIGLRIAFGSLSLAQGLGLTRFAALFGARGRALASLPLVPGFRARRPLAKGLAARSEAHGSVAVLEGCVMRHLYGRVNRATLEVLAAAGLESRVPEGHVCCGALHAHNGELAGARQAARETIAAFEALDHEHGSPMAVVVNSAGCGAHMKEYGRILEDDPSWSERAQRFAARVVDASECLSEPASLARLERAFPGSPGSTERGGDAEAPALKITYDDPCHLCHGQKVRAEPRRLLDLMPGIERTEMPDAESCCGSAGLYSLLRPRASAAALEPKLESLRATAAQVLVTANPGCQMQWESALKRSSSEVRVMHWIELMAASLGSVQDQP